MFCEALAIGRECVWPGVEEKRAWNAAPENGEPAWPVEEITTSKRKPSVVDARVAKGIGMPARWGGDAPNGSVVMISGRAVVASAVVGCAGAADGMFPVVTIDRRIGDGPTTLSDGLPVFRLLRSGVLERGSGGDGVAAKVAALVVGGGGGGGRNAFVDREGASVELFLVAGAASAAETGDDEGSLTIVWPFVRGKGVSRRGVNGAVRMTEGVGTEIGGDGSHCS